MAVRVGHAVVDLSSAELALFRTPRVTLLEISRRLRRDMDVAAVRRMLLSLATTPAPDGRRARGGRPAAPALRPAVRRRGTHAWRWDETAAAHDPAGAITAWIAHVRTTERELGLGLRELLAGRQTEAARILAAHGMRGLAAALRRDREADGPPAAGDVDPGPPPGSARRPSASAPAMAAADPPRPRHPSPEPPSPEALRALEALRGLDAVVAELARIERVLGGGPATIRTAERRPTRSRGSPDLPLDHAALAAAIDEDLRS